VLILGFTFKENCPDVRNTRVIDIVQHLNSYHLNVTVHDPWADPNEVAHEYGVVSSKAFPNGKYDAVILAVAHKEFSYETAKNACNENCVLFDVKGLWDKDLVDGRL
jgi:UDP-N-acetyl-D-galactosamine dehydrogenase